MTGCTDCYKFNANEALEKVKIQAKQTAIDTGKPQAVYQEGQDYYFTNAETAITNGYQIISFSSSHY